MIESFQLYQCRGIEATVTDTSSNVLLVKASVASVSGALAQLNSSVQIYSNIYGQSIQAKGEGLVIFQFRGFDWTFIEDRRLDFNSIPRFISLQHRQNRRLTIQPYRLEQ